MLTIWLFQQKWHCFTNSNRNRSFFCHIISIRLNIFIYLFSFSARSAMVLLGNSISDHFGVSILIGHQSVFLKIIQHYCISDQDFHMGSTDFYRELRIFFIQCTIWTIINEVSEKMNFSKL